MLTKQRHLFSITTAETLRLDLLHNLGFNHQHIMEVIVSNIAISFHRYDSMFRSQRSTISTTDKEGRKQLFGEVVMLDNEGTG